MLFDKYRICMTAITGLVDVRNMGHGFFVLTRKNVVFSVTIITIGCPFRPLHDHLGMETLQILLLSLLVASCTVHPFVRGLLSALGVFVILNPGMAIGTGKFSMGRIFKNRFGHKEGETFTPAILFF
jgi:hypothetical protein